MAAIITENHRRANAQNLIDDISGVQFYIGLGRSKPWPNVAGLDEDAPLYDLADPLGTIGDDIELLNDLITLVGVTISDVAKVIPNVPPKVSHRHKAYSPYDPDCFYQTVVNAIQMYPCYTVVSNASDFEVYLCLREATAIAIPPASYSLPSAGSLNLVPFAEIDGSVWVYMYTVPGIISGPQFVDIPEAYTLNGGVEADITTATGDLVFSFTIKDGGTGYVTPTVEFISDTGAVTTLAATVDTGVITSVAYPTLVPGTWVKARGYVKVTGAGAGARIVPNIAPTLGLGYAPASQMNSWYVGIKKDVIEKSEVNADGSFDAAYIPYRQVSLIKDPGNNGTPDPLVSLNCLQTLDFGVSDAPVAALTVGATITQVNTGAVGFVDYYDFASKRLFYHQTIESNFVAFDATAIVIGAGNYIPTGITASEYTKETGKVIFAENRKKITRSTGQTDEITIILQF
jgi:hypothetical protein